MEHSVSLYLFSYIFVGEMIGTMFLVFLGNGINAMNSFKKTPGHKSGWLFVNIGWAGATAIGILFSMVIESIGSSLAYEKTGIKLDFAYGLINPSFDVTMLIGGVWASDVGWLGAFILFLVCVFAQFVGAILGQVLLDFIYWKKIKTADVLSIKKMHCTHNDDRDDWARNMFTEFTVASLLTSVGVIVCGFESFSIGSNLWVPFVMGLSLGLIRSSIGSTAFAANPARDLGPRFVFLLLPLQKAGICRDEQIKLFDFNYTFIVAVLCPFLGGIFVGVWCWLVPTFHDNYIHSIYIKNPYLIFTPHTPITKVANKALDLKMYFH